MNAPISAELAKTPVSRTETPVVDPLATERAEANIRLTEARREHGERVAALSNLTVQHAAKEKEIAKLTAERDELDRLITAQNVRVVAAQERVKGAEKEVGKISKDRVRRPNSEVKTS